MKFGLTLIVIVTTLFLSGCPQQQTKPLQPSSEDYRPAPSYLEHTIVYSGETLAEIALHYTGRASNWMAIRDVNPGIRPERLRIGQTILIPRQLVVNERPFVKAVSKKTFAPETPATEAAARSEEKTVDQTSTDDSTDIERAAEATAVPTPVPTAVPTPVPTIVPLVAPSAPASAPDNEREKLLDELLQ